MVTLLAQLSDLSIMGRYTGSGDSVQFKASIFLKTSVNLKLGYFNSYRQFLLDKSSFLNLIDPNEMLTLSDYKIDELLYHRVENKKDGFHDSMKKEASYFEKVNRRKRY
jgi:hypothetical protein